MRTKNRTRIASSMLLVGAMLLLAGCGDQGSHLPASMTGANSAYATGGSDILGGDPGPLTQGVRSGVDDPVLTDTTELDELGALSSDDPFQRAVTDWNENAGVLGDGLDDFDIDSDLAGDDFLPARYGGYGYDDGWGTGGYGYGRGVLGAAGYGGVGVAGGFIDPGFEDAGMLDAGIEDPGFIDGGFDAGFVDAGMDVGFVDAGFDAGFDPGFVDVGFDPGVADVGVADVGVADAGFVDVGGFDAGIVF